MADEKNAHQSSMNMDVLADMISLADKQDVSGETMRTHQEKNNTRVEKQTDSLKDSESAVSAASRRKNSSRAKKVAEPTPEDAVAAGLTDLHNQKAKHAPAPRKTVAAASAEEVANTLDTLFTQAAEPAASADETMPQPESQKTEIRDSSAENLASPEVDTEVSELAEQAEVAEPVSDNREEAQTEEAAQEDKTAMISSEENTEDADEPHTIQSEELVAENDEDSEPQATYDAEEDEAETSEPTDEESTASTFEDEKSDEDETAEPAKTLRDVQNEKIAQLRESVRPGAMPLFYSPEPTELSELASAVAVERERLRAERLEQERRDRMERRREEAAAEAEVTSHRRRRRRRGTEDIEIEGNADDEVETVTKVRTPRLADSHASDTVTGVRGSTRLEAKRARRRESRSLGRRRHIVTEAEFLARRESVDRQMLVRQKEGRIQIGVLEDGVLAEHFVSKTQQDSLIGNVYLGKVQNVLPSMEAAFVDIGRGRNAVLYAGEVNWDVTGLDGAPRKIENALKPGDSVLVQVTKDPIGHKGARLTSQVSLPGRFLVYVPGGSMTGISRKLPDTERARLKKILKDKLPDGAGVIVRTAAEGASEEELTHDINRLRAQWEEIQEKANSRKVLAPEMLYQEPDLMIKTVRDVFNEDFTSMIVQGQSAWDSIEAYVTYVAPDLLSRLQKWEDEDDLFDHYRINEQLAKALDRKVYLPSGGSLVIDRTEAMTVVDVNTGKFTGSGGNLEETVTKNNLEAAEEIVRQLRLRDIGGIIVIDFIDMVLESNRDLVLRRLIECLGRDRTKHQVAEVTSLGLVQMTRKRLGTGLLEVFSEQCDSCGGRGLLVHDQPLSGRSGGASDFIHRQERTERKRSRAASRNNTRDAAEGVDSEKDEKKAERRNAMASIAAASHSADELEAEDQANRKKRKRRKRSRRTETAELSLEQEIQGIKAGAKAHREVSSREDKVAEVTETDWIGEQGDFTLEQLAGAFDRDLNPEHDARFTRESSRSEAIRAGEAKARASQKAGRITCSESGGFKSNQGDESSAEQKSPRAERENLQVEDVHESPRKRRRSRRSSEKERSGRGQEQRAEESASAPRVSGVIGGAPRVSGVITPGGSASNSVETQNDKDGSQQKIAAPAASSAPRKRRSRRAASSAGAQSKVVTVDATESAHGSVVASASVADAKAPVESEAPTLFGIGVSAADIKRVGKED